MSTCQQVIARNAVRSDTEKHLQCHLLNYKQIKLKALLKRFAHLIGGNSLVSLNTGLIPATVASYLLAIRHRETIRYRQVFVLSYTP